LRRNNTRSSQAAPKSLGRRYRVNQLALGRKTLSAKYIIPHENTERNAVQVSLDLNALSEASNI
jgi:hypothetical protein